MISLNRRFLIIFIISFLSSEIYAQTISLNSTSEGGNSSFSGEFLETNCAKTGVVMYHGRGASPDGPVVSEMRHSLHRAGYSTLSIDNPKPLNNQTNFSDYVNDVNTDNYVFPEAYARMRTAINYLRDQGVQEVVVAGFSMGSRLASAHVARGQLDELPIAGMIGVGMYGNNIEPLNVSSTLDEINVPVLDLYGNNDTNAVNTASARLSAYNSGAGIDYTQTTINCVSGLNCHQLEGRRGDDSQPLEVNINAWMQAVAPAALVENCSSQENADSPESNNSSGGFFGCYSLLVGFLSLLFFRRLKFNNHYDVLA